MSKSHALKKYGLAVIGVGELMWAGIGHFDLFVRFVLVFSGLVAFLVAFNPKMNPKPNE